MTKGGHIPTKTRIPRGLPWKCCKIWKSIISILITFAHSTFAATAKPEQAREAELSCGIAELLVLVVAPRAAGSGIPSRRERVKCCRRSPCSGEQRSGTCALLLEQVDGESLDLHVAPLYAHHHPPEEILANLSIVFPGSGA